MSGSPKAARPPRRGVRILGWVFLIVAVVLGLVLARVVVSSREALERGDELAEAGEVQRAALAYREAVTWYYPGYDDVTTAIERMWALAQARLDTGDRVGARMIVGELRSALYAIRSVYQPHEKELRICDLQLAELLALTDERVAEGRVSASAALEEYRVATARDHAPSVGWSLALTLGFLGWIAATGIAIVRLVPDDGPYRWKRALPWIGLSGVCLATWMFGAALA